MTPQARHGLSVESTHDEYALQTYVSALRMYTLQEIGSGLRGVYESRVKPGFEQDNGRAPADEHEVRHAMMADPYCRTWSSMMRSVQEMIWDSVIPSIERAQPGLNARANPKPGTNTKGSLTLDPSIEVPRYVTASDIHLMPGSYYTERAENDVSQGALYDRGVYVYAGGHGGPYCDTIGRSLTKYLKIRFPDFAPTKVLDVGCTVAQNTVPFAQEYPDAEVHAIDVSAPVLRYAHGRAESLGEALHLHQMDAEAMAFEDNSFDLVASTITFHETSRTAMRNILKECHRVLKPGGLMIHMELPRTADMDPFDAFYIDWDAYYNNEPFYQAFTSTNMKEVITGAGFADDEYVEVTMPDYYSVPEDEFHAAAIKADQRPHRKGRMGEGIHWTGWGAWKKG
jgi:ubiquinone/menaquinone biosynthesis C-methylase UbiE